MRLACTSNGSNQQASWLPEVREAIVKVLPHAAGRSEMTVLPTDFLGSDLGLSSLAVARLAGLLQKRAGRLPLPFHKLFIRDDGTVLHDIRVSDLIAFLDHHLKPIHT